MDKASGTVLNWPYKNKLFKRRPILERVACRCHAENYAILSIYERVIFNFATG